MLPGLMRTAAGTFAIRLQLRNDAFLLPHRLAQSRDESLVVAHARDAHALARPPLEHALVLAQVTFELDAATLRIGQPALYPGDMGRAFTLGLVRQRTYRLQSLRSLHVVLT